MRLVLALFVVAACGGKPSAAPAWPKTADKEVDGGESLEPHAKASAVAAATKKDEGTSLTPEVDPTEKPAVEKPKADAETPKPATTTGSTPATDEIVITTEEIVIEIDE